MGVFYEFVMYREGFKWGISWVLFMSFGDYGINRDGCFWREVVTRVIWESDLAGLDGIYLRVYLFGLINI